MTEQIPVLIIIIPLLASLFNILIGLWRKSWCYPFVVSVVSICLFLSISLLTMVIDTGAISYRLGGWAPPWGIEYVIDHLNAYILLIVSFISVVVAVYSKRSIEKEISDNKIIYFNSIYLLLVTGLFGITITGDVFNVYVFLEITSLAGYALIAIGEKRSPLASFNYVIMGTIGACFYLLGVGYLYISTGTLNMADLAQRLPDLYQSKVVLVAFTFFMVGIAIKIAFFPLHVWLPDAYTYAPSAVSAFAASTMTKVGIYVMIRVMFTVFQPVFSLEMLPATEVLGWMASVAMMFGCIMALAQTDLKRMLTYILIAEVGYIVMGISVGNRAGFTGAVLHILNDAFMMATLFLIAGAIMYKKGERDINNFANLNNKMPLTMACFTITAISMVGIPPTAGFFSKWYLLHGAINAQKWFFVAFLLSSSLMVAAAFFKIIQTIYFSRSGAHVQHEAGGNDGSLRDEAPFSMLLPIVVMSAALLVLGLFSGQIVSSVIQFTVPEGF